MPHGSGNEGALRRQPSYKPPQICGHVVTDDVAEQSPFWIFYRSKTESSSPFPFDLNFLSNQLLGCPVSLPSVWKLNFPSAQERD